MATVEQKIANAPLGSFPVHSDSLDATGARVQYVKMDVGAPGLSVPVTALNPLPVSAVIAATSDINIDEYGGTATTLGQKAMAASIPVTIASNQTSFPIVSGLIPFAYDYISLSYTGADLTGVVFKTGGAGGTTVATLTLTYTLSVLQTVTRT